MLFIYHGCPGEGRGGQKLCYFLPTIISAYGAVTAKHIPYRPSAVSWLGGGGISIHIHLHCNVWMSPYGINDDMYLRFDCSVQPL